MMYNLIGRGGLRSPYYVYEEAKVGKICAFCSSPDTEPSRLWYTTETEHYLVTIGGFHNWLCLEDSAARPRHLIRRNSI